MNPFAKTSKATATHSDIGWQSELVELEIVYSLVVQLLYRRACAGSRLLRVKLQTYSSVLAQLEAGDLGEHLRASF